MGVKLPVCPEQKLIESWPSTRFQALVLCFDVVARKTELRNSCPSCKKGLEFFIEGRVKKALMEQNGT